MQISGAEAPRGPEFACGAPAQAERSRIVALNEATVSVGQDLVIGAGGHDDIRHRHDAALADPSTLGVYPLTWPQSS